MKGAYSIADASTCNHFTINVHICLVASDGSCKHDIIHIICDGVCVCVCVYVIVQNLLSLSSTSQSAVTSNVSEPVGAVLMDKFCGLLRVAT